MTWNVGSIKESTFNVISYKSNSNYHLFQVIDYLKVTCNIQFVAMKENESKIVV